MTQAPHNGTRTSEMAAEQAAGMSRAQRLAILAFLRFRGDEGATREEIELATGMSGNAVRPRVWELVRDGVVATTNRTRKTVSGRLAEVVVLPPASTPSPIGS